MNKRIELIGQLQTTFDHPLWANIVIMSRSGFCKYSPTGDWFWIVEPNRVNECFKKNTNNKFKMELIYDD